MNNFDLLKKEIEKRIARIDKKPLATVYSTLVELLEYAENLQENDNNGWISVNDNNPTTNDYVFVLLYGRFPALGKYDKEIWEAQALGSQYLNLVDGARVTHWKPAPQLPKEQEND